MSVSAATASAAPPPHHAMSYISNPQAAAAAAAHAAHQQYLAAAAAQQAAAAAAVSSPTSAVAAGTPTTGVGPGGHNPSGIFNVGALLNQKDSRWLQLEVCREFQRNKCCRKDCECKFAHPADNIEVQNGRVTACYDSIKVS